MPTEDQLQKLEDWNNGTVVDLSGENTGSSATMSSPAQFPPQPTASPPVGAMTITAPPAPPSGLAAASSVQAAPPPTEPDSSISLNSSPPPPSPLGTVATLSAPTTATPGISSSNSSNSFTPPPPQARDLPSPPALAIYHGLAGRIVELIRPHTEADPVALLLQLLVTVGNIIGRSAYMMADGSRHHFNLFVAIVGDSSKARKGTSWNQIIRIMAQVDPEWRQKCVTSGLSSGEGLISAVRDPSYESIPASEGDGEPQFAVKDEGVDDKRLCVIEGELATPIKRMAREGNTLSTVIREAWDGNDLSTLVKTNKTKATAPHISIIGHITREELRRQMEETDMWNGYANRFLWGGAGRSQCLPEGGSIVTVDFAALIEELRSVVQFATTAGEIRRSEDSRALWRDVYPALSEGRPGLLGAVTGRAEAQVMRLSGLYALMDRSLLIRPEHHHAAMALWDYCARSARWIFGGRTGNKNADKILKAFRHAGPTGLTNTEIQGSVFKNNLPAAELREALEMLQNLGLADVCSETTAGANAHRWFLSNPQGTDEFNEFNGSDPSLPCHAAPSHSPRCPSPSGLFVQF